MSTFVPETYRGHGVAALLSKVKLQVSVNSFQVIRDFLMFVLFLNRLRWTLWLKRT